MRTQHATACDKAVTGSKTPQRRPGPRSRVHPTKLCMSSGGDEGTGRRATTDFTLRAPLITSRVYPEGGCDVCEALSLAGFTEDDTDSTLPGIHRRSRSSRRTPKRESRRRRSEVSRAMRRRRRRWRLSGGGGGGGGGGGRTATTGYVDGDWRGVAAQMLWSYFPERQKPPEDVRYCRLLVPLAVAFALLHLASLAALVSDSVGFYMEVEKEVGYPGLVAGDAVLELACAVALAFLAASAVRFNRPWTVLSLVLSAALDSVLLLLHVGYFHVYLKVAGTHTRESVFDPDAYQDKRVFRRQMFTLAKFVVYPVLQLAVCVLGFLFQRNLPEQDAASPCCSR